MPQKFLAKTTDPTLPALSFAWPPDYKAVFMDRQQRIRKIKESGMEANAFAYYSTRPTEFIEHWCITYDPRNAGGDLPTVLPFILFPKQKELIEQLVEWLDTKQSGLVEKSRDMGATWLCCAFSVWLWLFHPGASVGWGSRKGMLVDRVGDPDSIFEKMRMIIRYLPDFLKPEGLAEHEHMNYMRILHPENGSTITGESGDNIGRGGRKLIYFKDESAHYERAELIEASLADNTDVQIDISSVNGAGNIFYKKRHSGHTKVFIMDWRDHPGKTQEWYDRRKAKASAEGVEHLFAQEIDRDYSAAVEGILIPSKYIRAAIDAHIKLGFGPHGERNVGLDVADEGIDKNALVDTQGPVVLYVDQWSEGNTGETAITGWNYATENKADRMMYDSIGVGAGVKAKTKELQRGSSFKLEVVGFNAGDSVAYPERNYVPGKKNKDMFKNLKAQVWWLVRDRFIKTYRAVVDGEDIPHEELISLPSDLPYLDELMLELSRPKRDYDAAGRLKVESKKDMKRRGVDSPNIADALIMCYHPKRKAQFHIG